MGCNADRYKMTQGKDSVRIRSAALLAHFTIARAAAKSHKVCLVARVLHICLILLFNDRLTFVNAVSLNLEQPPCLKWSSFG